MEWVENNQNAGTQYQTSDILYSVSWTQHNVGNPEENIRMSLLYVQLKISAGTNTTSELVPLPDGAKRIAKDHGSVVMNGMKQYLNLQYTKMQPSLH